MADASSMKYLIKTKINVDGTIQRKDVVGAIFGQTEGLLGDELNLRVLQRSGRLGHVDVELESSRGKVSGSITIPSSLDNVETAIIGSALETIERIGPCRSTIKVEEILDVRASKRQTVIDRAKDLLRKIVQSNVDASRSVIEEVRAVLTVDEAKNHHGMTAGPNIESSDALIIVEGRNDVINLLSGGIKNAIAVEGAGVKDELIALAKKKSSVTAFVDGDRGGELVLRELHGALNIDEVAIAPVGQEVEHLEMKTITKCLSQKEPVAKVISRLDAKEAEEEKRRGRRGRKRKDKSEPVGDPLPETLSPFATHLQDLKDRNAMLMLADDETSEAVGASKLDTACAEAEGAVAILFKGKINSRILEIAADHNIPTIVGTSLGENLEIPEHISAYVA